MDDIIDKQQIDVFGQVGGNIPVRDLRDVIDFLNHLVIVLAKQGLIPAETIFMQSYEKFVESKGNVSGTIQIRTYNLSLP